MDGVGQQPNRSTGKDHEKLDQRCGTQTQQRELDRVDPLGRARQCVIYTVCRIVAVGPKQARQEARHYARCIVVMLVRVVMMVMVIVLMMSIHTGLLYALTSNVAAQRRN